MASPFCASADSLALLSETDRHVEHDDGQDHDRFDARSSQEGSMSLSLKKRHPHEEEASPSRFSRKPAHSCAAAQR
jgi:hypothetical protein